MTTKTTAGALRIGTIVLHPETGEREFAAFDVQRNGDTVTVWTATSDQTFGWPRQLTMPASTPLRIA